jgi:hypothetical protein
MLAMTLIGAVWQYIDCSVALQRRQYGIRRKGQYLSCHEGGSARHPLGIWGPDCSNGDGVQATDQELRLVHTSAHIEAVRLCRPMLLPLLVLLHSGFRLCTWLWLLCLCKEGDAWVSVHVRICHVNTAMSVLLIHVSSCSCACCLLGGTT